MTIKYAQSELTFELRGGSDVWDQPQASVVLDDDFFEAPTSATGQIKVWTGSAWVAKPVKIWDGAAWTVKPLKFWNGSTWTITPY